MNMIDLILLAILFIIIYCKPGTISAGLVKIHQVYIQEWAQNKNHYLQ